MKRTLWILLMMLWATAVPAAELTVVTEILSPWQTSNGRDVGGIATEVVEATLREADVAADIKLYPWTRAYRMALKEPNVLIYSMVRTPIREPLFKWVGVIGSVRVYFFHKANRTDIRLDSVDAARRYLTIVPRDDFRHQFLVEKGFKKGPEFHLVNRQEQALRMLYAGRGDLILEDELTLAYELRQFELDPEKIKKTMYIPEMSFDFEMACSKKTPDSLVKKLQAGLQAIKAKGLYYDIMRWHEIPDPD